MIIMVRAMVHDTARSLRYVCIPMDHEQRRQQRLQCRRQPSVIGSKGTGKHKKRLRRQREYSQRRRTEEQRQAILQRRRDLYHHQRQVIIAEDSSNQCQPPQPHRLPWFDDPELIIAEIRGFHDSLAALQSERCYVCLEGFPNMSINDSSSCKRCDNDKHIPKLFSAGNNMDPAWLSVPLELTVSKTLTIAC